MGQPTSKKSAKPAPPTFDSLPELVTIEEAAAYRRVSVNTMYSLVRSGALASIRTGRQYRIPRQALIARD